LSERSFTTHSSSEILAGLAAVALFLLAYPPFAFGGIGFVACAPIAWRLLDDSRHDGWRPWAARGWMFGHAASIGIVGPWMYFAAHDYFAQGPVASAAFVVFVTALYVAIYYACCFPCLMALRNLPLWMRLPGFASIWTAWELVRATLGAGNPWALLGQTLVDVPWIRGLAAVGGVWALTWIAAFVGAGIGTLGHRRLSVRQRVGVAASTLAVLLISAGIARWASPPTDAAGSSTMAVGLVQADIAERELWRPDLRRAHVARYIELSERPELAGVRLLVWPENAVPLLIDTDRATEVALRDLARRRGVWLAAGVQRSANDARGRAHLFTSLALFAPDGSAPVFYDKRKLLPFVESDPWWRRWTPGPDFSGAYTPGAVDQALLDIAGARVAPLVCFESLYEGYALAAARAGARLLLNISNDSWFGRGAGPEQHFEMSRLRAVEHGLALVRVSNGGVSGVVAPDGSVLARLPAHTDAVARVEVPVGRAGRVFTYAGKLFVLVVSLAALALFVAGLRRDILRTSGPGW
jgi:apolipoprotein N-acyltransferase